MTSYESFSLYTTHSQQPVNTSTHILPTNFDLQLGLKGKFSSANKKTCASDMQRFGEWSGLNFACTYTLAMSPETPASGSGVTMA